MEEVNIGLCEETASETSPDFDEAPHEPPAKKCRQRKALTKKERESLVKEVRHLPLSPLTTYCLDVTRSKLVSHANPAVKEFALSFEPPEIFFIVTFLKNTFASVYEDCAKKKDKFITFQFQWHQHSSILLVKNIIDVAKLNLDPGDATTITRVAARQQWVGFYNARNIEHEVAKIFMLIFSSEVYKKLLKHSHSVIQMPAGANATSSTIHADSVDVYYRFGGATLASMLQDRYKAMKLEQTKHKEKISEEIYILQALNTKDKGKVPNYLQYRDKGFMYFPREELVPFLQEVDVAVKSVCNESGFKKYGASLVQETTKFVCSGTKLKEKFSAVLTSCFESPECLKSSSLDNVFNDFVSKLTNTRIQEFLDSFKASTAMKKGTASVSGQNLRDTLLTQHVNSKSKKNS